VKSMLLFLGVAAAATACLLAAGCIDDEDEQTPCEKYCDQAQLCSEQTQQMFSASQCARECDEASERYESVGCDYRYEDYLECASRLGCGEWGDIGDECANDIDSLNSCVD
jgi:hypothetical protein